MGVRLERYLRLVLLECVTWPGAACQKAMGDGIWPILVKLKVFVTKLHLGVDQAAEKIVRRRRVCRVGRPVVAGGKENARGDPLAPDPVGESRGVKRRLGRDEGSGGGMDGFKHDGAIGWTTSRSNVV